MFIFYNPNPERNLVGDCVVRACAISQQKNWHTVHEELSKLSNYMCNMPSANIVWGNYMEMNHMKYREPEIQMTVRQFCLLHPYGTYTIGTGSHAVTVIDGDWYDIWDSGDEIILYYFERS
jgi:hypothetical protein